MVNGAFSAKAEQQPTSEDCVVALTNAYSLPSDNAETQASIDKKRLDLQRSLVPFCDCVTDVIAKSHTTEANSPSIKSANVVLAQVLSSGQCQLPESVRPGTLN